MAAWILISFSLLVSTYIFIKTRKDKKINWTHMEKILFTIAIALFGIDALQTYLYAIHLGIMVEINPIFGREPSIYALISAKAVFTLVIYLLLRKDIFEKERKFIFWQIKEFNFRTRKFLLIGVILSHIIPVVNNVIHTYHFVYHNFV